MVIKVDDLENASPIMYGLFTLSNVVERRVVPAAPRQATRHSVLPNSPCPQLLTELAELAVNVKPIVPGYSTNPSGSISNVVAFEGQEARFGTRPASDPFQIAGLVRRKSV